MKAMLRTLEPFIIGSFVTLGYVTSFVWAFNLLL